MENADTVHIDEVALEAMANRLRDKAIEEWDKFSYHYTGPNVIDYVFALDAVNFCFWPRPGFEYEHMATNLKKRIEADENSLKPEDIRYVFLHYLVYFLNLLTIGKYFLP